jgi:hypothetical protein
MFGYQFGAGCRTGSKTSLTVLAHAGCYVPNVPFFANNAGIKTLPLDGDNAALITLPIFKAALKVMATAWDATWCAAYPWDLIARWPARVPPRPQFQMAWITYLSPRFAPMVTPPRSAITEYTPEGGIIMIATKDRFEISNPAHMAVARDIQEAIAPVNALPWPPDAEPAP